jgi:HSP20 family protein
MEVKKMTVPMKKRRVYDPFDQLRIMQQEMDEMFENFFSTPRRGELTAFGPRAPISDIEDKGDSFELQAELPGMKKEDINIEVGENSVTVSAEHKAEREDEKKNYYYHERTYSGYRRTFALPQEIDPDKVEAEYKNGVLRLNMKKVKLPELKTKHVKVK